MIDFNRREPAVDNTLGIRELTEEVTEEIARLNAWILRLGHAHRNQELRRRIEIEREVGRAIERAVLFETALENELLYGNPHGPVHGPTPRGILG